MEHYFNKNTKFADVILTNYKILTLLPRFNMSLGIGEKRIDEVCQDHDVDVNLFVLVCNVATFNDYLPHSEELMKVKVNRLIDYLLKSHTYFLRDKILCIEHQLFAWEKELEPSKAQILYTFFNDYKNEIIKHFDYEETEVFPYIFALEKGNIKEGFSIHQFEENHGNIEDKLSDLKNIIIKYLPETESYNIRNQILENLFILEEDLMSHNLIEDKVLVPLVEQIEKSYEKSKDL